MCSAPTELASVASRYVEMWCEDMWWEGDPKGLSTVLVTALGSWEKTVHRGHRWDVMRYDDVFSEAAQTWIIDVPRGLDTDTNTESGEG
jgi:hypothetical protein